MQENAKKPDAKCKVNKFLNLQLNLNLCVIGCMICFNIGKYMFSEKIFIKKAIFVLVINESREKMLENNNRKIVKTSIS